MRTMMQSLLAATAILTLAPAVALALPQYCHEVCDEYSSCDQLCVVGSRTIVTCGDWGICGGARDEPSEVTASATHDEARQSESTSSRVCSDEQPTPVET